MLQFALEVEMAKVNVSATWPLPMHSWATLSLPVNTISMLFRQLKTLVRLYISSKVSKHYMLSGWLTGNRYSWISWTIIPYITTLSWIIASSLLNRVTNVKWLVCCWILVCTSVNIISQKLFKSWQKHAGQFGPHDCCFVVVYM